LALVSAWGLVGCARKPGGVVLRFSAWGSAEETKIIEDSTAEFKKDHPGVEVQLVRVSYQEYVTKLLTQFSAGNAPDVMQVAANDHFPSFASKGVFLDIKPYLDKDPSFKLSDFYPEALERFTVNGTLAAIPRNIFPIAVIYYNKKAFDKAGLPYPKNDWDFAQFLATAQKLTKKDAKGNTTQFGFVDEWPNWEAWIFPYGGTMTDDDRKPTRCTLDSPEAIAGVQYRADLIHKYHVMPGPSYMTALGGLGNSDLFMNGTVAMFHSGLWQVPSFRQIKDFDWDVVEFPAGPKGKVFVMEAGGYGVTKSTAHPDLAVELVKYLAGEKGQRYIATMGSAQPALRSVAQSPAFLNDQVPKSKGFLVDAVKYGRFESFDPNIIEWRALVSGELDRVWAGTETAEAALKKVTKEVNTKFFKKP
jgi:multiple sugar transport system substrate-binding protein